MEKSLFVFLRNHRVLAVLLVAIGLACTLYPRFNRQDPSFIQPLVGTGRGEVQIDMKHYLNLVGYFRGTQALESVAPPFAYRPLVPWMIGMASGLALFGYSFVSAYADGRFVWTAYPFMIGLSLQYFRNTMNSGVEGEPVFDDRMTKAGQRGNDEYVS